MMNWIKKIENEAGWAAEYGLTWLFKLLVKVLILKAYYLADGCRYHYRQIVPYPKPSDGSAPKPEEPKPDNDNEIPF